MKSALGLMSGTSGDGVSIALAGFEGKSFETAAEKTYPYPASIAKLLPKAAKLQTPQISELNAFLGRYFADCAVRFIRKYGRGRRIAAAGSHGHTVFHAGSGRPAHTLQIGEPSYLAQALGIPVVSDFRPADIAAGGQGAPLIPFFDRYFFGGKPRAMQNIGGIGNVTFVGGKKLIAFDTGPGNCLIDEAVQSMTRGKRRYDEDGKIAARGRILFAAVEAMMRHPYFKQKPPKSTGRELFNERFLPASLKTAAPEDRIATLTYFTASAIRESYRRFLPSGLEEAVISGGGALNRTLMRHLAALLAPIPVLSIEKFRLPAQAKEPVAFAFFALRAVEGKTNHCPEGTGARREVILGKITPASAPAR